VGSGLLDHGDVARVPPDEPGAVGVDGHGVGPDDDPARLEKFSRPGRPVLA
jgi:hypothetical protein